MSKERATQILAIMRKVMNRENLVIGIIYAC